MRLHLPVTVALLRDVRLPAVALAKAGIDPCEKKKTKRREFARRGGGVFPGLPAGRYHCHGVSIAHLLIRERRGEVLEKDSPSVRNSRDGSRRLGENRTELWCGSSARVAKLKRGRIILLILLLGL